MLYIDKLTSDPLQKFILTGIPGVTINAMLRFMPRTREWFMDIAYNGQSFNGIAVVSSPNILRSFRGILPFGICCATVTGLDPFQLDSFSAQKANLYLLTADDVQQLETELFT